MAYRRIIPLKVCAHCGNAFEPRKFNRRGHSTGIQHNQIYCSGSCRNLARNGTKQPGHLDQHGYRYISMGSREAGKRYEHHLVMEKILGRSLLPGETVHHKNGDRADNRPANLELWSGRHGCGQRVHELHSTTASDLVVGALALGG